MTDEELRDLVVETSRVEAENNRAIREMREEYPNLLAEDETETSPGSDSRSSTS